MYVVRLKSMDSSLSFSAFSSRLLALSKFEAGQSQVIDARLDESTLFDVASAYDGKDSNPIGEGGKGVVIANLSSANDRSPGCGLARGFGSLGVVSKPGNCSAGNAIERARTLGARRQKSCWVALKLTERRFRSIRILSRANSVVATT
jgi:hypothetical protein